MSLFNFLKSNKNQQFIIPDTFEAKTAKQKEMTPLIVEKLRELSIGEDGELKLEFFFYTNSILKAEIFAQELEKLNYEVQFGSSAGDKKLFIITGWTTQMKIVKNILVEWTDKMCHIGFAFDCEFDGWGTSPDQ